MVSLKLRALAKVRGGSRSSCRLSLRRDYEQGSCRFCEPSLRWGHLAWARWCFAKTQFFFSWASLRAKNPGRASTTLAQARRARL